MAKTGKAGGKVPEDVQVKQQRCLDLVVQGGLTYAEIADEVGYSGESSVRAAVNAVLQRADNAGAEVARPRMIARAEALWVKAYRLVERGEQMFVETGDPDVLIKGLNSADRALARLSKLHHLDAPDVSVVIGGDPAELERLKRDALALLDGSAGDVVEGEVVDSTPE